MKQKVRKIIAREGLIIIFLMLLAGISFFLNSLVSNQKEIYKSNVQEIQPFLGEEKISVPGAGTELIPLGIILQFPQNTSNDVITNPKERFP